MKNRNSIPTGLVDPTVSSVSSTLGHSVDPNKSIMDTVHGPQLLPTGAVAGRAPAEHNVVTGNPVETATGSAAPTAEVVDSPKVTSLKRKVGELAAVGLVTYAVSRGHGEASAVHSHVVNEGGLSIFGIRRWNRANRRAVRASDAAFHAHSANAVLESFGYKKDPVTGRFDIDAPRTIKYDAAAADRKQNIKRPYGPAVHNNHPPDLTNHARTAFQAAAAENNGMRLRKVIANEEHLKHLEHTYTGYDLLDKKALKKQLSDPSARLTMSQRRAILKASREARRTVGKHSQTFDKVVKAAEGNNLPGKYLKHRR